MARILVIDDEECIRFTFKTFLEEEGYEVVCAENFDDALVHISSTEIDLVFADIILEGKTGIEFLRACRDRGKAFPVTIVTGYPDVATACEAVRLGAFDYIAKPLEREGLLRVARLALSHKRAADERERSRAHLDAIFQSVDDVIVAVDGNLVVTGVNAAARTVCGIERGAVGRDVRTLPLGCQAKCLATLQETISTCQPLRIPRLECGRTVSHVVDVATFPILDQVGTVAGAVMMARSESLPAHRESGAGERQRLCDMLGGSEPMQQVYSLVSTLAEVDTTVLITGETGTGKELVAEALHRLGPRRNKLMVKVNCSALPESLLESELFGHVKGAFTGAATTRIGRFETADGGTIFLDEIGDLSPRMQSSLLRVLQRKEFERVGESVTLRVNARIVAATNKDLRKRAAEGAFREDLLYRLEVVEVHLPPLRERREDIPLLVEHFLEKFNRKMTRQIEGISDEVERIFMEYSWPGNIRELEHALEHAAVMCNQPTIAVNHLPDHLVAATRPEGSGASARGTVGREAIMRALAQTAGNKQKAARLLGIDRKTLYRNMAKYHIDLSA